MRQRQASPASRSSIKIPRDAVINFPRSWPLYSGRFHDLVGCAAAAAATADDDDDDL